MIAIAADVALLLALVPIGWTLLTRASGTAIAGDHVPASGNEHIRQ